MIKANILLLGGNGSGKTSLVQALSGKTKTQDSWYSSKVEDLPLCLIDPGKVDLSQLSEYQLIHQAHAWSKKEKDDRTKIDLLWFTLSSTDLEDCEKTLKTLLRTTEVFGAIPALIVLTRSYSTLQDEENIELVESILTRVDPNGRCREIIPVVSKDWALNEAWTVPSRNLDLLIQKTNELLPEELRAGEQEVCGFLSRQKQILAQSIIVSSSLAAAALGAVPLPFADAAILTPLEILEINGIARIYGIHSQEETKQVFQTILTVGTVSAAARTLISGIKSIPGLNLGAAALNALVAGCVCASLGEGSAYVFSQIAAGTKSPKDLDWITQVMEGMMSTRVLKRIQESITVDPRKMDIDQVKTSLKDIVQALADLVSAK